MKKLLLIICFVLNAKYGMCQRTDTFHVHFASADSRVNKEAEDYIDRLLFKDLLVYGQKMIVLGYADYVGNNDYNDKLSAQRAKNVQEYLTTSGLDQRDIKLCEGKGKIDRPAMTGKAGYRPDRRVDIIVAHRQYKERPLSANDTALSTPPITVNKVYPLNIMFDNGSSMFLSKSIARLHSLLNFMMHNKTVKIQIEGHVCCITHPNSDGLDVKIGGPLSWNRAKAVYNYLLEHGIKADRIKYKGFGGTKPVVTPERTEEDMEKNRRVEVRILSK
ncbi:MAG: OmpA family protein [Flavipsychrobacter sp.]|nr:OmpA family protein [Flavipsychrobacter sp.]